MFADVARSWSEGNWPLLSPYSWACSNLAGEFQYGTFSLFVNAAVVAIWKFDLDFAQQAAALSIAHLFVLAMGGYLLARGRELSAPLALMVALVAALNGWMICWGASDWFGALGGVRVAAVGMVGSGARARAGTIALGCAAGGVFIYLRDRGRVPVHGLDVGAGDRMARRAGVNGNTALVGADTSRVCVAVRARALCAGVDRAARLRAWLAARGGGVPAESMDGAVHWIAGIDSAVVDSAVVDVCAKSWSRTSRSSSRVGLRRWSC